MNLQEWLNELKNVAKRTCRCSKNGLVLLSFVFLSTTHHHHHVECHPSANNNNPPSPRSATAPPPLRNRPNQMRALVVEHGGAAGNGGYDMDYEAEAKRGLDEGDGAEAAVACGWWLLVTTMEQSTVGRRRKGNGGRWEMVGVEEGSVEDIEVVAAAVQEGTEDGHQEEWQWAAHTPHFLHLVRVEQVGLTNDQQFQNLDIKSWTSTYGCNEKALKFLPAVWWIRRCRNMLVFLKRGLVRHQGAMCHK